MAVMPKMLTRGGSNKRENLPFSDWIVLRQPYERMPYPSGERYCAYRRNGRPLSAFRQDRSHGMKPLGLCNNSDAAKDLNIEFGRSVNESRAE